MIQFKRGRSLKIMRSLLHSPFAEEVLALLDILVAFKGGVLSEEKVDEHFIPSL